MSAGYDKYVMLLVIEVATIFAARLTHHIQQIVFVAAAGIAVALTVRVDAYRLIWGENEVNIIARWSPKRGKNLGQWQKPFKGPES